MLATFIAFLFVLSSCVIPMGMLYAEGEGTAKGDFVSCSISLGTDITVNYKVRISDSLVRLDSDGNTENVSVKFTFTGVNTRESEVKGTKLKDAKGSAVADMWLFRFTGVNPQCMGDVLSAQLVVDGAADAKAKDMTVKDYCMELIKGSTDAHLINLVKDLLVYGREAQKYVGYRPGKLVVDNDFAGTTFDALKSDSKYHAKNTLETTKFKSGALYFDNTNKLMFRFVTDSIENLKVTINDKEVTPVADGDTYVVMTDSIAATGFDDIYTVKLILNGETVSTLECSVKAYVYQMQNSSKMRAFANATYAYGLSAKRYVSGTFDENNVVLSFGALSDVHFDKNSFPDATEKLKKAVNQLTKQASKNGGKLDAITFVGDFTNISGSTELKEFKSVYESVVPAGVKTLLVTGNHETLYSSDAKTLNDFKRIFGDKYFGAGIDTADTNLDIGVRDIIVNGYHFLMLEPTTYSATAGCPYKKEAVEWLDNMLKKLTAENPEQYVFVCTHPMIYNTCYGSDLNGTPSYWSTTDLTPVLDKYSQAVTFSGHLHFPINDNRSIMQGNFTSLGCGSVRYMAIEAGGYEDMYSATQMNDRYDISSGLFVQVDKNGNTRITRMFFSEDDTFDSPWEISYPNAQKTHLEKYSREARTNANTAPELGEIKLTTGNVKNYGAYATVVFDAAKDDEFAHHYNVTVKNKDTGATISNKNILSDFYRHAKRSDMKKEYTLSIGTIKSGTYSITVTAYDSWGAKAEKTVDYKVTINADTAGLPAPYVNFEFTDGKIADKMGNVDITNSGATVGATDVKFGGKTNKLGALTVPAGKYVVCKFNKLNTADEFRNWAEGCFTVEAFYVNSKNGGIQGVVCGTQDGGWGIAENAGKPYFITGGGSKYNPGAYAGSVSSITELVHVVGIYDTANKKCTIYINGKKNGEVNIAANFIPGVKGTHNYFCLGDDITLGLVGGDFKTQGMTMVDAKIYDDALTSEQIAKVYAIAENLFATGNDSGEYSTGAGTATCEKVGGTPETPETPDTPEAPEGLYADIDIVDGKVVDKYGNLKLTPNDGKTGTLPTIGTEELTYGGKTKTLPTIKITKMNQYVAAVFGKFATADEFQDFVRKNGLTFEVLYKNDGSVSAVGGIFCSTQYDPSNNKSKGGFGIATQAKSGAPYVIAGANGNAYTLANGNTADYTHGEITHVIGTIDTNGYVTIYVNGKDGVKSNKGGTFNCSKGNMSNMGETFFNTFYIGGDPSADKSGKVSDYPLTSASFIDIKVYSKALTGEEAKTAYEDAQKLFAPDTPETPEAPEGLYADIDIVEGKVVDKYGNLKLTVDGVGEGNRPTIGTEEITYGDKTKTLPTIKITGKNQFVAVEFDKFADAAAFQNFVKENKGLSFEVLYQNNKNTKNVIALFCSTNTIGKNKGGFGLALQANGTPYALTSVNGTQYQTAVASAATSGVTHLVGTITDEGIVTLYVNGVQAAKTTAKGSFLCTPGTTSNQGYEFFKTFFIGGDPSLTANIDFPMVDGSFMDVKVYSKALTGTEVETAYKNAQNLFN